MLRAENLIWISGPSKPYDEKFKQWPQWTTWDFMAKNGGDLKFIMGIEEHEVYLAEKALLKFLPNQMPSKEFLKLIEVYGDRREEKGRSDVEENWAESRAGEGV